MEFCKLGLTNKDMNIRTNGYYYQFTTKLYN